MPLSLIKQAEYAADHQHQADAEQHLRPALSNVLQHLGDEHSNHGKNRQHAAGRYY
jgi:hypothetical protein